MIDRNIRIENLDPRTWNNVGVIYDALARYRETVYVLLREGGVARIVDSRNVEYGSAPFDPARPEAGARRLFELSEKADRVVVAGALRALLETRFTRRLETYDIELEEIRAFGRA